MPALTRLQIQALICDIVNDPSNTRWSAARKQAAIQVAMEMFVEDTRALTDVQSFSVVAADNSYALSTDTLDIIRVTHNGLPLQRMSKFDLDAKTGTNWTLTNGTPINYYVDYTSTNKDIILYPVPQGGDAGTNNLVLEYLKVPPTLSSDSSVPLNSQSLLQPYSMALAYQAATFFLRSSTDPKDWQKAAIFNSLYEEQVSLCREIFRPLNESEPRRLRGGRYFRN